MVPLILVVEDNEQILYNIKLILEFNKYNVITSKNGKEALKSLSELKTYPDLIISDIIMPEMNGYDFFKVVSENPLWNRIPFVFLSARISPEDVRFGKALGVDDYLKKPFTEKDLLAVISGKIARAQKNRAIDEKIRELSLNKVIKMDSSIKETEEKSVILFKVDWDDKLGPTLADNFPSEEHCPFSIKDIGIQLYQAIIAIYGYDSITHPEGFLLTIENIQKQGYVYFNTFPDEEMRERFQNFMLALIAPKINYFESLKIKKIFRDIALEIKQKRIWDIKNYFEQINEILSTQ